MSNTPTERNSNTKITLTKAKKRRLLENGRSDILDLFQRNYLRRPSASSLSTKTHSLNQQPSLCSHTDALESITNPTSSHQKKKASSQNKTKSTDSSYMKNKEGIQTEDYLTLGNLIKCLSDTAITTKEAFEEQSTKLKFKKGFLERVANSLVMKGCSKPFTSSATLPSMKQGLFNQKAFIMDKLKTIHSLSVFVISHTVAADNLIQNKPDIQTSVILVVRHERGLVHVGKGRVIAYLDDDDTKVRVSVSGVESNSDLVFNPFMIGLVVDWEWNLLTLGVADLGTTSASSLVGMTPILDPNNNHVDNSVIFNSPPSTVPPNRSTAQVTPQVATPSPIVSTQPKAIPGYSSTNSTANAATGFHSSPPVPHGLVDGRGGSIAGCSASGHTKASNHPEAMWEQERKCYEEKLAQQQNDFVRERNELVRERDEFARECNELKRKVDELIVSESAAKKKCCQVEYHYSNKKRKVQENAAKIWGEDDEDDLVCTPKSFKLRGISHSLTNDEYLEIRSSAQFGAIVDRLIAISKITIPITMSDIKELDLAVNVLSGAAKQQLTIKQKQKRWDNYKQRHAKHFQTLDATTTDGNSDNSLSNL